MSLAMWYAQSPARLEWFLLRGAGFVAGLILYPAALQLYHGLYDYIFVDSQQARVACWNHWHRRIDFAV